MKSALGNKVAIVTGAGGDAGSAIAAALGMAGVHVAVNDINPDRAERVGRAIRDDGGSAMVFAADVANRFQCVDLIESVRAQWGRLDILVNNASVKPTAPILKMDEWAWQRCLDVNLKGAFFMSQLVGRVMADENQDRGGVIINVGAAEDCELAGSAAYAASKAGLEAFTSRCAAEFASLNVRVSYIRPGQPGQESGLDIDARAQIAQAVLKLCASGVG